WDLILAKILGFIKDENLPKEDKKLKKDLFNVNSTKQLANFLVHLGCNIPKTKKGNLSVNENVLKSLESSVPLVKYYLQLRKVLKKLSTYVTKSRDLVFKDGKFHPNFVLIGNDTSRFMANNPNCLNFPKNAGKEIRNIISAPKGYVMITADFKNLEVRGEAIFSGDEELAKIILNNFDMHSRWSEKLFGKSKAKEYRHKAKNGFVFPILYGAGVKTLCQGVGWELTEQNLKKMAKIRNEFWQVHPKIKIRHENMMADYEKYGEIYDMCGRFRLAPIERGEGNNKSLNYNAIINYQIQSSCFYFTMNAWFYLLKKGYWAPFELHDELIVFVREGESDIAQAVKDIHYAMTELNHKTFSIFKKTPIRLGCDMKIGKSFGNLVKFDFEKYLG
ncbi:DNA polymerase, partial [Desulfonauticus submarinus]